MVNNRKRILLVQNPFLLGCFFDISKMQKEYPQTQQSACFWQNKPCRQDSFNPDKILSSLKYFPLQTFPLKYQHLLLHQKQ